MSTDLEAQIEDLARRLNRVERELEALRAGPQRPKRYSLGVTVEQARQQLAQPAPITDVDRVLARSIIGILDDPDLPSDLAEHWHEYRYGSGRRP